MKARDLSGRTAVITGAASGIGRALAIEATRRGMVVVAIDMASAGLAETAALAGAGASIQTAVIDVRDAAALKALASEIDTPTMVFVNAGLLRSGPLMTQPSDDFQLMIDVNLVGALNTLQAFCPAMTSGHIVITGSQASFTPFPDLGVYSATKHALLAVADALRSELEAAGATTTVSLLAPGSVVTDIYGGDPFPNAALGILPEAVAQLAFEGALRGDAIISTHAALADQIERRFTGFRAALASR